MSRRRRERSAGGVGYTIPASNAFGLPDCRPAVLRQLVREKSLKPFRKCGGKNEMIQFIVGTIVGGMIGVAMMCLMQINRLHRHDREVEE